MSNNSCSAPNSCSSAPKISTFDDCRSLEPAVVVRPQEPKGPYIKLNPNLPGIVAGFMYDMANARNLTAMATTIMRRARNLSVGERELIFAYTSRLNECEFCAQSHEACAAEFLGKDLVAEVVNKQNFGRITPKIQALLNVAKQVQSLNRSALPRATEGARLAGATDQEIHDAVLVASFASMCNRYVDGLGTQFKPGEPQEGGKGLAKFGYKMSIRRFFVEVLPQLWAALRAKAAGDR